MIELNRMARGAIGTLIAIAKGHGLMGVPSVRKPALTAALLESTGGRLDIHRGRRVLLQDDRLVEADDPVATTQAAPRMAEWMRAAGDVPHGGPTMRPSGAFEILERMGANPGRVMILLEALHYVALAEEDRLVEMTRSTLGASLTYRRKDKLRWTNGLVVARHRRLPGAVASALVGKPLSMLIDDPLLADRTVRKLCDVDPREGVLRIVTMDEGRRVPHAG